jgi:hypothetical protein
LIALQAPHVATPLGQSSPQQSEQHNMTPHHKPRNVTLTKISRLNKGPNNFTFVPDTASDKAVAGEHLGFEVSQAALMRIRAGLI